MFSVPNHHTGLKELGTVEPEPELGAIKSLQYVPGVNTNGYIYLQDSYDPLREDQVWVGTESKKILIYSAQDPERGRILGTSELPQEILLNDFPRRGRLGGPQSGLHCCLSPKCLYVSLGLGGADTH